MLLFSQPYLENRLVLVGRQGADVSATALTALKGKRIAIVEGYCVRRRHRRPGRRSCAPAARKTAWRCCSNGGVDYTLMDELVVQYIVNNYPKEAGARLQIGFDAAGDA